MKLSPSILPILLATSLLAAGCALDSSDDTSSDSSTTSESALSTVSATLNNLTVALDQLVVPAVREGRRVWLATGRTNKKLTEVFSFVPDDAFGAANLVSSRSFELVLEDNEFDTILLGLPLFVRISQEGSSQPIFASVSLAPRYSNFSGSSKVFVNSDAKMVIWGGEPEVRGGVSLGFDNGIVSISHPSDVGPNVLKTGARTFNFDFNLTNFHAASSVPAQPISVVGTDSGNHSYTKYAYAQSAVSKVLLTAGDPYSVWPALACKASVQTCLDKLAFGSYDTGSCGTFYEVRRCTVSKIAPIMDPVAPNDEIFALTQAANAAIGPNRRTGAWGYTYRWHIWTAPSIDQILQGLMLSERYEGSVRMGAITEAQANTALTAYGLPTFLDAARRFAYNTGLSIGRIKLAHPEGTGLNTGNADVYVFYYPMSGQVLSVELATK